MVLPVLPVLPVLLVLPIQLNVRLTSIESGHPVR